MEPKTTEWRPGPSVCRCCLTEGCYKDIATEYFWMGKREVYEEMLSETLNVSISYSQSGGPNSNSRLICEPCISRLRDATEFKRQVQECEKTFMQHLDPSSSQEADIQAVALTSFEADVKIERVKLEEKLSDDDFGDRDFHDDDDDDDDDLDNQPLMTLATKIPKKESVDLLDLLDNTKATVKRKSSSKVKGTAAKKTKTVKREAKAGASKSAPKVEKKKKGNQQTGDEQNVIGSTNNDLTKRKYTRSARAEARIVTKRNATSILKCWTVSPFRWKKNRFKCAYCEADFTQCFDLREHVKLCATHHSVKDIYNKFKEMPLINVDITDSTCRYCNTPYVDVKTMQQHVIQHGFEFDTRHPDGVLPFALDKLAWRCVICAEKFNNFLKLYEHMNVHYQHYICATCGKGYMTAPRLRKHSEVHISGSFPCSDCGRIFTMRAARDAHKASAHAKGPRYECPHCNMRFDGYYDRMEHMKITHSEVEVSYSCPQCGMSFKTSGKRAIHVRSVHFPPQMDFSCTQCEWQFKSNYELKRHMVRHTGEKKFHCSVCVKSFPRKKALTTHMKTHQDLAKWRGSMHKPRIRISDIRTVPTLSDLINDGKLLV